LARRATLIDSLRAARDDLVLVDAGAFVPHRESVFASETASFVLEAFAAMGYDAVACTAVDSGLVDPADVIPGAPVLDAVSCAPDDSTAAAHVVLRDVADTRVGIFAICQGTNAAGRPDVGAAHDAARRAVHALTSRGARLVVALTALDAGVTDSVLVGLPEVDVVVTSHGGPGHFEGMLTPTILPDPPALRDSLLARRSSREDDIETRAGSSPGARAAIRVDPGGKGRSVDVVHLLVDEKGDVVAFEIERVLLNRHIPPEREMNRRVVEMTARVRRAAEEQRRR